VQEQTQCVYFLAVSVGHPVCSSPNIHAQIAQAAS